MKLRNSSLEEHYRRSKMPWLDNIKWWITWNGGVSWHSVYFQMFLLALMTKGIWIFHNVTVLRLLTKNSHIFVATVLTLGWSHVSVTQAAIQRNHKSVEGRWVGRGGISGLLRSACFICCACDKSIASCCHVVWLLLYTPPVLPFKMDWGNVPVLCFA